MPRNTSEAEPKSEPPGRAARIRAAIDEEYGSLLQSVSVLVARSQRLRWSDVREQAAELLHEAVQEALRQAHRFDPSRSATAWVRGIAARLLLNRRRSEARDRRCVPATVLGEEAWATALGQLCTGSTDAAVAGRLDLKQALGQLSPEERHTLECRYYRGLDGEELARALGVTTPGAARVRVCRALQVLRAHLVPPDEQVGP
jgi:RNA polymerase sigma-70 factor (ECF subfamily)